MKKKKLQIKLLISLIGVILAVISCKKDDSEDALVKTGNWTGTGISFTVEGTPQKITNLEFSYSGHATGSLCSFDYESGGSFAQVTELSGNTFTTEINTFVISGNFSNDTIAEIEITWTNYDSNCDANYSGNRTYIAKYLPSK
jgi:hypothetical protein